VLRLTKLTRGARPLEPAGPSRSPAAAAAAAAAPGREASRTVSRAGARVRVRVFSAHVAAASAPLNVGAWRRDTPAGGGPGDSYRREVPVGHSQRSLKILQRANTRRPTRKKSARSRSPKTPFLSRKRARCSVKRRGRPAKSRLPARGRGRTNTSPGATGAMRVRGHERRGERYTRGRKGPRFSTLVRNR
jgi:hypothetical protein